MSDSHRCYEHFAAEHTEFMSETVVVRGLCGQCGRALTEVYDYTGTLDVDTDEWVNRFTTKLFVAVVHPPDANSYVFGTYRDAEAARNEVEAHTVEPFDIEEHEVMQ